MSPRPPALQCRLNDQCYEKAHQDEFSTDRQAESPLLRTQGVIQPPTFAEEHRCTP
jgi:hypothetical protein